MAKKKAESQPVLQVEDTTIDYDVSEISVKKGKKQPEPQYVYSAIHNQVMNYKVYKMSAAEKVLYLFLSFVVGGLVGLVFYGDLFKKDGFATTATYISNTIVFCAVGIVTARLFLPFRTKQLKEKRKNELKLQARDMLESLSASLSTGKNVMDSFQNAYHDLKLQYSDTAYIVIELKEIIDGLNNNIAIEDLLRDFGKRSENEDILNFSDVFAVCYRKGGNLKEVIRRTHDVICDKMEIADEIETKLTSNKTQQKIMNVTPIVLVALLRVTNESFAENFAKPAGVLSITVAIMIFVLAYWYGQKIVDIKG